MYFLDRATTKLGARVRSRGLTPAAQNVGSAAARSQRALGAGLKSSQENMKPLDKPSGADLKKQVRRGRVCFCMSMRQSHLTLCSLNPSQRELLLLRGWPTRKKSIEMGCECGRPSQVIGTSDQSQLNVCPLFGFALLRQK